MNSVANDLTLCEHLNMRIIACCAALSFPMTKILGAIILLSLFSCCGTHTEVDYSYNGTTIERVDECGKTTFYYRNGERRASGKIWCEYSGINDGFSGYLRFGNNGKVEVMSGDGYFQSEGVDTTKFQYKKIYSYAKPIQDKNISEILLSTRYEQERNRQAKSEVEVAYREDTNQWW